jgi:hypothetical protein
MQGNASSTRPRHAGVSLPLIAAACVIGLVTVRFAPRLVVWRAWALRPEIFDQSETGRAQVALWQVDHLGKAIEHRDHKVQRWRLLFPTVAAVVRLPAPVHLALYPAGAILAVAYLAEVLRRAGLPSWQIFAALAAVTANCWFFTATGWLAYCDGWVALGLLIVTFSARWQAVLAAALLLPWADDRFILGTPLALAVAWVLDREQPLREGPSFLRRTIAAGAGIAVAVSVRAILAAVAASDLNAAPIPPLGHPDAMLAAGFWHNLRAAWLLIPAAVAGLALRHGGRMAAILTILAACCFAVPYAAAYDQSRAAVVLLPLAVIGVFELAGSPRWWPLLPAIAAANLVLPASHMMLLGFSQIDPLWTEFHRLHQPPKPYRPDDYAIAAVEQSAAGNPRDAAWLLGIACSLQCEPALVARTRALLALDAGKPEAAVESLRRCVTAQPVSIENEALLAVSLAKTGEVAEARSLAARLLAEIPADHPCRVILVKLLRESGPAVPRSGETD